MEMRNIIKNQERVIEQLMFDMLNIKIDIEEVDEVAWVEWVEWLEWVSGWHRGFPMNTIGGASRASHSLPTLL